jgi:hypothetical protein
VGARPPGPGTAQAEPYHVGREGLAVVVRLIEALEHLQRQVELLSQRQPTHLAAEAWLLEEDLAQKPEAFPGGARLNHAKPGEYPEKF